MLDVNMLALQTTQHNQRPGTHRRGERDEREREVAKHCSPKEHVGGKVTAFMR